MISKGLILPDEAKLKDLGVRVWVLGTNLFPWILITIQRRGDDGHLYDNVCGKAIVERERYLNNWLCERQRIVDVIAELERRANGDRTANSSSNIRKQTLEEVLSLLKDYTKKEGE